MEEIKYFFSAGEHSGDMHGAILAQQIKRLDPEAVFWGMGGPLMAEEGVEILYDPTKSSTIGFWEALKNYSCFKKQLGIFTDFLRENKPDIVVWVDFGGFNVRLAEAAKVLGIPVVCIFPPSAWAYGKGRAARLAKSVQHLISVLPFEADFYREYGMKVSYVGHPLVDLVQPSATPEIWRQEKEIHQEETVIALVPGSRLQEVNILLPVILGAAKKLDEEQEGLRFFLPVAPTIERKAILDFMISFPKKIELIESSQTYNLMKAADFAVIASGTSALEAAIMELPMIIVYRVSKISAFIYRKLANQNKDKPVLVGLPNFIAGRMIVPEILQEDLTVERLYEEMLKLYDNYNNAKDLMADELKKVHQKLGDPNVMERAAQLIVAEAQTG